MIDEVGVEGIHKTDLFLLGHTKHEYGNSSFTVLTKACGSYKHS